MKPSSSGRCWCSRCRCCCCWVIMLFVASSVVNASPEIATTFAKPSKSSQATLSLTSVTKGDFHESATVPSTGVPTAKTTTTITTANPVAAEMMTIMIELSAAATVASEMTTISPQIPQSRQIATNMSKSGAASEKAITTTTTTATPATLLHQQQQQEQQTASLRKTTSATPTGTSAPTAEAATTAKAATTAEAAHHNSPATSPISAHRQNHLILPSTKPPIPFERQSPSAANERRRSARQADVGGGEQADKCRLFVEGEADSEKNELYSPDYPNDYPKNINCTRVITAPKGQRIRLDFRNSFHIEAKEECKFDFLEIRDGQYGFSTLIGKYCGTDFPPEITSKERYLWLHFHSDESIEYSGFTAVYEFIDRNREAPSTDLNCTIIKDEPEGWVNASDIPQEIRDIVNKNKIPLDCMWRIQVQEKWKILVKFYEFRLSKPNDCETNFLDIFPEETVMPLRVKNFCGSAGEGITSDSNILHIRFYAEQTAATSNFGILYTAFHDKVGGYCADGEYDCEDATCISDSLRCNSNDNCKFRWDEEGCKENSEKQSEHVTIIITVFGLILGGMVITFLINCVRKIMRDQKIIREHIRQSRESKLNEMGRQSKSRDNISVAMSPRQKHSQTSLQILDDVSNRYYREVIPVAVQTSTKADLKEKEHSILRHRHDMTVQTSLCGGGDDDNDSSTTTTTDKNGGGGGDGGRNMACDMGCQTRESLFASTIMRQKSKTPSLGGGGGGAGVGMPLPPRFSTFGYEMQQIPSPTVGLSRHSIRIPQGSAESEEQRHSPNIIAQQHQSHHATAPVVGASRQPEICHHHHQHQQHLQQQHQQQQQQQQKPSASQTLPQRSHYPHQHAAQQQQQQQHYQSKAHIPPLMSAVPQSTHTTAKVGGPFPSSAPSGKSKPQKVDESKVFIDIRNSAPDVIIMTSH